MRTRRCEGLPVGSDWRVARGRPPASPLRTNRLLAKLLAELDRRFLVRETPARIGEFVSISLMTGRIAMWLGLTHQG